LWLLPRPAAAHPARVRRVSVPAVRLDERCVHRDAWLEEHDETGELGDP
jgi:hypothetical protein